MAGLAIDGVLMSWLYGTDKRTRVQRVRAEADRLRPTPGATPASGTC
jgi:hypothetical protein